MKIGITADCSSCLEYAPFNHNIRITRTTIHFDNETLIDGIDITADQFYLRLESSDIIPSTSAPTLGQLYARVEELKALGCTDIIHFPISYNLSTYGENWEAIKDELFTDINFYVFNSNTACIMQGYNAKYAEILASKGYNVEQIFNECAKVRANTNAFFVVDDIKYLIKNGRLNTITGFIGNLAKIKPILELNNEGRIVTFDKVRTHRRAVDQMIETILARSQHAKKVLYLVQHSNRYEEAVELAEKIKKLANNIHRVEISTITPTVGAHIGSGLLGIGRIILDDLNEEI